MRNCQSGPPITISLWLIRVCLVLELGLGLVQGLELALVLEGPGQQLGSQARNKAVPLTLTLTLMITLTPTVPGKSLMEGSHVERLHSKIICLEDLCHMKFLTNKLFKRCSSNQEHVDIKLVQ